MVINREVYKWPWCWDKRLQNAQSQMELTYHLTSCQGITVKDGGGVYKEPLSSAHRSEAARKNSRQL